MPQKVVILDSVYAAYREELGVFRPMGIEPVIAKSTDPAEMAALCRDADGICLNLGKFPADLIGTLAKCRMAVRRLRQQGRTDVANQSPTAGLAQEVQMLADQMLQKK